MQQPFTIRHAYEKDARALAEVHVAAWQWAYRGHMPDRYLDNLSIELRERKWRDMLASSNAERRVWLAECQSKAIGFVTTGLPEDPDHLPLTAELGAIYVLEEVAGLGIGRALMIHSLDDLRQRGFRSVFLWVLASNTRARHFYELAGWYPDGATRIEPRDNFELHDVRYSLELNSFK